MKRLSLILVLVVLLVPAPVSAAGVDKGQSPPAHCGTNNPPNYAYFEGFELTGLNAPLPRNWCSDQGLFTPNLSNQERSPCGLIDCGWNDTFSSMVTHYTTKYTLLFADINYGGGWICLAPGHTVVKDIGATYGQGWDNAISSLKFKDSCNP